MGCRNPKGIDRNGHTYFATEMKSLSEQASPALRLLEDHRRSSSWSRPRPRSWHALRSYADKATNGQRLQRQLFTEDAVQGFAFVDLCQKRFDVVLMNPPFGEPQQAGEGLHRNWHTHEQKTISMPRFVERGIVCS